MAETTQNATRTTAGAVAPASTPSSAAERALTRAEWQDVLFAESPRRHQLLALAAGWPLRDVVVRVHRNHPFEYVASAAVPYLAFGGWRADYVYTAYDDTLSLSLEGEADAEIVWLDFERYAGRAAAELAVWLGGRLEALRAASDAPILVADGAGEDADELNRALAEAVAGIPGVHLCPLSETSARLGGRYFDPRMEKIAATRMSDAAAIAVARAFATWLPAVLAPPLKAIVLDLDHTLYRGVLGEDGAVGVELTEGHRALQAWLREQRDAGVFLGLCSRNEATDVETMFTAREDFPLTLDDFSATSISWDSKSQGIARIAEELRIGLDAVLFVDDNPGELAAVATALPDLELLHAAEDATRTLFALRHYPGLLRWEQSETDRLRVADLAADRERRRVVGGGVAGAGVDDYLTSLQIRLSLRMDPRPEAARLHDISHKTNQFNTGFQRFSAGEVARRLDDPEARIVSIHLRDRLSDSGSVGAVYAHRETGTLVIDEIAVSCRALGRHLEEIMLCEAIAKILDELPAERIVFHYQHGPRNEPARKWLGGLVGEVLGEEARRLELAADAASLRQRAGSKPVEIAWETPAG